MDNDTRMDIIGLLAEFAVDKDLAAGIEKLRSQFSGVVKAVLRTPTEALPQLDEQHLALLTSELDAFRRLNKNAFSYNDQNSAKRHLRDARSAMAEGATALVDAWAEAVGADHGIDIDPAICVPPGYSLRASGVIMVSPDGKPLRVCPFPCAVISIGRAVENGMLSYELLYAAGPVSRSGMLDAEILQASMALGKALARRGAMMSEPDSRATSAYLIDFINANRTTLPEVTLTTMVGWNADLSGFHRDFGEDHKEDLLREPDSEEAA